MLDDLGWGVLRAWCTRFDALFPSKLLKLEECFRINQDFVATEKKICVYLMNDNKTVGDDVVEVEGEPQCRSNMYL